MLDSRSNKNGKNKNTVNSFKTKKPSQNTGRYSSSSSSQRGRRTLPELPKRERTTANDYGFPSYTYKYRSTYDNDYAKREHRNTENAEHRRGQSSSENKNKNTKNEKGILKLMLEKLIGFVSLIKGGKRSNARIVKNKTVSAKRNSIARPIFVIFIILCFIYLMGSSVNFLTKKIVNYDVLSYGTIDTPKSANAIIIRSEKVYNADKAGVISYDVADNEKVKKGALVCSIKDEAVVAQMQAGLDDINEQIMKIQSERKDLSVYSEDIKKYNSSIKNVIDENAMDYAYMKLGNIYELSNTVNKELDTRNQYLLSENTGELKDLVSQKKEQESKLNENISNITAEESGIVSYYIDGLEEKLNPDNMSDISKSDITDTVKAQSSFKGSVKANSPAFKLVTSNIWYIASYINKDYIKEWEKGDTRSIYIKDENGRQHKLETHIQEMVSNDNSEVFVIFKITRDMTDFINMRNITIETENSELGYKIPNSAIVEETLLKIPTAYVDSDSKVMKVENQGTKDIAVSVSGKDPENSDYSYIPVQMGVINVGDTIKSPVSDETFVIADVLNTRGIYVINTGIAEFRTIDLNDSVSNSTHTILNPSHNSNIYVYDRIMTDPRNVEKEQMVYE